MFALLEAEVGQRVSVLPRTGDSVHVEGENAVGEFEPDGLVVDLRVVEMEFKRLAEVRDCNHQFTVRFEFFLEFVSVHDSFQRYGKRTQKDCHASD